jgi:hypothetical protein
MKTLKKFYQIIFGLSPLDEYITIGLLIIYIILLLCLLFGWCEIV